MKLLSLRKWEVALLLGVAVVGAPLFFLNLGNMYLWQDEAQTALIAKSILQHGIPKGHDDKNSFSQELGAEYDDNDVWKWHPWLPFYLLAGSFKLFGTSAFVARLPFAILGFGCVFMLYFFSKSLWRDEKSAAMGMLALLFCIPFLLLARQSRYYSPSAFFSLAGLYGYHAMVNDKRSGPYAYLAASVFLCHTHYVYLVALLCTAMIHMLVFRRDQWKRVLGWTSAACVLTVPWVVWLSIFQWGKIAREGLTWESFSFHFGFFLRLFEQDVFPMWLVLVPIGTAFILWALKDKVLPLDETVLARGLGLLVLFILITVAALSFQPQVPYFRYLAPLVPPMAMIIGLLLGWAMRVHVILGVFAFGVLIASSRIRDYAYELTHDFDGPIEGIVRYLDEHADPDDTVAITFGDLPIKFYTNLRVIGGYTGEDLTPARQADWVIIRKNALCDKDRKVKAYLQTRVPLRNYERIVLDCVDTAFENRESVKQHRFRTARRGPPVEIYRRRSSIRLNRAGHRSGSSNTPTLR